MKEKAQLKDWHGWIPEMEGEYYKLTKEQFLQARRAVNAHDDLLSIAKAYRNLLRTAAHTEGEVATFHHINDVLAKAEGSINKEK